MNSREVLETVRGGNAPASWQVVHARKSFFVGEGALSLVIALIFVAFGLFIGALTFLGWSTVGWGSHLATLSVIIGGLGLGVWAGSDSIRNFRRIRTAHDDVLVLMPEGCVHGNLGTLAPEHHLVYTETRDISFLFRVNGRAHVLLNILPHNSRPRTWYLDDRFGPAVATAQRIIYDYTCYTAKLHSVTDATQPN